MISIKVSNAKNEQIPISRMEGHSDALHQG
jgi:uncharacterized protein YsxB (DUF464 family)